MASPGFLFSTGLGRIRTILSSPPERGEGRGDRKKLFRSESSFDLFLCCFYKPTSVCVPAGSGAGERGGGEASKLAKGRRNIMQCWRGSLPPTQAIFFLEFPGLEVKWLRSTRAASLRSRLARSRLVALPRKHVRGCLLRPEILFEAACSAQDEADPAQTPSCTLTRWLGTVCHACPPLLPAADSV